MEVIRGPLVCEPCLLVFHGHMKCNPQVSSQPGEPTSVVVLGSDFRNKKRTVEGGCYGLLGTPVSHQPFLNISAFTEGPTPHLSLCDEVAEE
jgi:hypothetical protein